MLVVNLRACDRDRTFQRLLPTSQGPPNSNGTLFASHPTGAFRASTVDIIITISYVHWLVSRAKE